jgi:hypothetical protein
MMKIIFFNNLGYFYMFWFKIFNKIWIFKNMMYFINIIDRLLGHVVLFYFTEVNLMLYTLYSKYHIIFFI